jgi:hypothetical protein
MPRDARTSVVNLCYQVINGGVGQDIAGSLTDLSTSNATGPLPYGRGSDQGRGSDSTRGSDQSRETDGTLRGTFDEAAAWAAFYEGSLQQCWGPNCETTTAEQYQAIVDKKCELGLLFLTP